MANSNVSIELLKYNNECKYEHFNTAWVSNYQELFEQCCRLRTNEKLDRFYSPQDVTYINCELGFRRLVTILKGLPKLYLYCIMENDPFDTDKTIKTKLHEDFKTSAISTVEISNPNDDDQLEIDMEYGIRSTHISDFNDFTEYFKVEDNLNLKLDEKIPIFVWPLNGNQKVHESLQTGSILSHFEKHLLPNGFHCNADSKSIGVKIPVNHKMFIGKVDAIVFNSKYDRGQMETLTYVSIEIKPYLESDENMVLSSVEFLVLGMILRSCFPVLHIQTDMEAFNFTMYIENEDMFFHYSTKSYSECKAIISNWVKYAEIKRIPHKNRLRSVKREMDYFQESLEEIDFIPIGIKIEKLVTTSYKHKTDSIIEYSQEFLNNLERAFLKIDEDSIITTDNRSGTVLYKLMHDGKTLVIKMCYFFAIDHLINETNAYRILKDDSDGPWPNLYYAGYMFNQNFYAIVTEFIDGRHPKLNDKDDFELCEVALTKLHDKEILHGDPTPTSFLICNNRAIILGFGFSDFDRLTFDDDFILMENRFEI